jgi:glucan-binding YG repeat protein
MKNIFIKKVIAAALTSATLLGVLPVAANAEWKEQNGVQYFTEDGENLTGWHDIKDKWYHFDDKGVLEKNKTAKGEDGKEYKLDANGVSEDYAKAEKEAEAKRAAELAAEAVAHVASTPGKMVYDKETKNTYYRDDNGKNVTGWIACNHKWYYFDKTTGIMQKDTTIEGHGIDKYGVCTDKNANLATAENAHKNTDAHKLKVAEEAKVKAKDKTKDISWKQDGDNWAYFNEKGTKVVGWLLEGSDWYYFDNNGVMLKNTFITDNDKQFGFGEDGAWNN